MNVCHRLGLFSSLSERKAAWEYTGNGNSYFAAIAKASKAEQTVDNFGNLTQREVYDHYAPGGTLWTLVENTYDYYGVGAAISPVPIPAMLRLHDTANYGAYMITRGNVTQSVSFGKTIHFGYDYTGNLLSTSDNYGHAASQAMDENRNYAVPKWTSQGGLQSTMTWNAFHAPLTAAGPNSDTLSFGYDTYARPSTRTEANVAVTTVTYCQAWNYQQDWNRWISANQGIINSNKALAADEARKYAEQLRKSYTFTPLGQIPPPLPGLN